MRKYITEFVGSFFLVFTVVCAVLSKSTLAPLAIGGVLAALVFAGGHISGAHYNPAVTVAVFFRGALPASELAPYLGAQVLGAVTAAPLARFLLDAHPGPALSLTGRHLVAALIAEILVTFVLGFVVLNVATSKDHPNNSFYGLAIGLTVTAGAVAVGGVSGGVFNAAGAIGVSLIGMISWSMLWVYVAANLIGGAAAAFVFRAVNPDDVAVKAASEAPKSKAALLVKRPQAA